jgi:hypothetical protein
MRKQTKNLQVNGLPVLHSIPWVRDIRHTPWQFRSISIQTDGLSPAGHPGTKRSKMNVGAPYFK